MHGTARFLIASSDTTIHLGFSNSDDPVEVVREDLALFGLEAGLQLVSLDLEDDADE